MDNSNNNTIQSTSGISSPVTGTSEGVSDQLKAFSGSQVSSPGFTNNESNPSTRLPLSVYVC